jgi:hypothetical protein
MAAKFTSTAEVRAPGRGIRFGSRTGPARCRARPRARGGVRVPRLSSAACREKLRREPRSTSSRSRRVPDAGRFGRSDLWSRQRRPNRSQPHEAGRRRQCWPPTSLRSVRISAPPWRSGRSEEISASAGASTSPPFPTWSTNHAQSLKSRSGSRRCGVTHDGGLSKAQYLREQQ